MRILVVNWLDRENPRSGGAEIHLHEVFGRLARMGHHVTVLSSGWEGAPGRAVLDGMDIHRVGGRHSFFLRAAAYARRHLVPSAFDVVVEDLNKVPLFTPAWAGAPTVLLVHHLFGDTAFQEAGFPVAAATWLLERPVPWAFRRRPVIAVSESTATDLVERGFSREAISVIPNGVDLELYRPGGPEYEEPTILYLGRLKRYKRVDLVLRLIRGLLDRGMPCRGVIAGRGDQMDSLRALAADLGVADRVEFPGFVEEARKVELFQRSWIHVLASPKEGWGIANLEAAACGTPTVASDSPGLRDSVRDGETGYLVPHGDVEGLVDRCATLLNDVDLRTRMGLRATRFAEEFAWDRVAGEWSAWLQDHLVDDLAKGG